MAEGKKIENGFEEWGKALSGEEFRKLMFGKPAPEPAPLPLDEFKEMIWCKLREWRGRHWGYRPDYILVHPLNYRQFVEEHYRHNSRPDGPEFAGVRLLETLVMKVNEFEILSRS